ncbi:MAG: hypothetical protein K2O12_01875, partial [Muribaculaceae bacterium]|nr:hypothetical protein [Muribaculaceae bacterium]
MKYSTLMARWRLRCGLAQTRDGCSLDYTAGIDIDALLHSRIADWYMRLVSQGHTEALIPADISDAIMINTAFDRSQIELQLPERCLCPVSVSIENMPCTIIDRQKHPRMAALVLAPTPGVAGATDGPEAVYDPAVNTITIPFCRSISGDKISCMA